MASALLLGWSVKALQVLIGLVWILLMLAAHAATPSISDSRPVFDIPEPSPVPRVDIYGNEIDEAVGDYRVDRHGELYERHAPDTAVLRLGPAGA